MPAASSLQPPFTHTPPPPPMMMTIKHCYIFWGLRRQKHSKTKCENNCEKLYLRRNRKLKFEVSPEHVEKRKGKGREKNSLVLRVKILSEVRVIGKYAAVVAVALTETCSCSTLYWEQLRDKDGACFYGQRVRGRGRGARGEKQRAESIQFVLISKQIACHKFNCSKEQQQKKPATAAPWLTKRERERERR